MKKIMKNVSLRTGIVIGLGFVVAGTAGWGPRTEQAIVNTAVQLISQEGNIPLKRLARHVQAGASIEDAALEEFFPAYENAPIETVQAQMDLLKTVESGQIDAYFAYRLGVLGKLVASVTAPMFTGNPNYKRQYYADVDQHIERTKLATSPRRVVEPSPYFGQLMMEAGQQESIIEQEYAEGTGFQGVGRTALSQDASRSVRAVADVWYTILTGSAAAGGVSERQIRSYVLGAMDYYVSRGNVGEIRAAYDRLMALNVADEALFQQVGNLFFDAGLYEQAVEEYQKVLARNPANREVADRMAEYYSRMGEQALERGQLEPAYDYFVLATETNKLHPTAQQSLIQVEKLIAERNARMAAQQELLDRAQGHIAEAERLAVDRKFALAVNTYEQARQVLASISDEFPQISQQANLGLTNVRSRLNVLQEDLIGNAQMLSGAGFVQEAQRKAAEAQGLTEEGLRKLTEAELRGQLQRLRQDYETVIQQP